MLNQGRAGSPSTYACQVIRQGLDSAFHTRFGFFDGLFGKSSAIVGPLFYGIIADIFNIDADLFSSSSPLASYANNVVLEITERAAIRDYDLFRESIQILRGLGFKIAIDDAGSGYASLQSIAELKPHFLKISNYLVTGLHNDTIKADVVEMLVRLAARIDASTVAEGIETEEELAAVKRLGVTYGQGYLLGRPAKI